MTGATPSEDLEARRALSLGIAAYLALWGFAFTLLSVVFGMANAVALSLVLSIPLGIALRLRFRQRPARQIEMGYLLLLLLLVFLGGAYVVSYWHDIGLDRIHSCELKFPEFTRAVRADPAFSDIHFAQIPSKGIYQISGTVASQADLKRLESLAERYGFLSDIFGVKVMDRPDESNKR
jgi:hypothetical protein